MKQRILLGLIGLLFAGSPVLASPHEVRIPLHDGKLEWADLSAAACQGVHLPPWQLGGAVNLRGWQGCLFLAALNSSLGDGFSVAVSDNALIFRIDPERLPRSFEQSKQALRTFVASENPAATAAQARRYGLLLPGRLDTSKPLVILIHGLDCDVSMLHPMGDALEDHGLQVAYFAYPADQGLADDVILLEQHLRAVHELFPGVRMDLVGHSMGGLIARAYVEGNSYGGDVDHLIMVGTPNSGSQWAHFDLLLKAQKAYYLSRSLSDWHWSWMITEGLGEGARDVLPHSKFLNQLNSEPRRAGVRYTIIAGSHSAVTTVESGWIRKIAGTVPTAVRNWWGFEQLENGLDHEAQHLDNRTGRSDGAVTLKSARLAGVKDMVIVPADHCALFIGNGSSPPAALPAILARLTPAASAQ